MFWHHISETLGYLSFYWHKSILLQSCHLLKGRECQDSHLKSNGLLMRQALLFHADYYQICLFFPTHASQKANIQCCFFDQLEMCNSWTISSGFLEKTNEQKTFNPVHRINQSLLKSLTPVSGSLNPQNLTLFAGDNICYITISHCASRKSVVYSRLQCK